jgi:3-hydroxyacyl-CoA dehydrogenase / enoyl-CoA hydratase / 3-hydroxybutyryl-CoA epimerase
MTDIFKLEKRDRIAVVVFDVPGEPVNTWTEEAFVSFGKLMQELSQRKSEFDGVVFVSGKATFHAGANLKMLSQDIDLETMRASCSHLNQQFLQLENLGIPSVAAINGHCMGGGYEFALAMTARIATDARNTLIGLPECTVGVIPGGGGTQRLPRLIGYPAIEMILRGKVLPAAKALEAGMIDKVVSEGEDLTAAAVAFLQELKAGSVALKRDTPDLSALDDVMEMARQGVLQATRGRELPQPMLAIRAMQQGLKVSLEDGLKIETDCFIEVLKTPESKGMINTFFIKTMSDKPQAMLPKGFVPKPINKVAVLGFGTMGRGIVIDLIRNLPAPVIVKDIPEALEPGRAFVQKILEGMAEKGRLKGDVAEMMGRITTVSEWTDDFKTVDLVIEAVFEDPAVKDEVYSALCDLVPADCILASNTSSLPVNLLAKSVKGPERFAGAHFFSPVWKMQLLEIIRGEHTDEATIHNLLALCAALRKRPVVCNDNPGFVVNAMLFPYFKEAFDLIAEGVPIEAVDDAMTKFGLPVGPIMLTDEVGIDISYLVLTKSLGQKAPPAIENVYQAGRYGRKKNGKGFYNMEGAVDPEVLPLINPDGKTKTMTEAEIQAQLFAPFIKTGKELLDKKVVDDPRLIDIGCIWGVGFPPDKGGPMKWADLIGLSQQLFGRKFYTG